MAYDKFKMMHLEAQVRELFPVLNHLRMSEDGKTVIIDKDVLIYDTLYAKDDCVVSLEKKTLRKLDDQFKIIDNRNEEEN